ncbi:hypothetical protein SESBI_41930 [Sesbania bispinosa]|nr:hypothetical protein SESBI_41930 [Sesbania bispinosa]
MQKEESARTKKEVSLRMEVCRQEGRKGDCGKAFWYRNISPLRTQRKNKFHRGRRKVPKSHKGVILDRFSLDI